MSLQICIDESGDTGYSKKSSRHFVMCAIVVDDLDRLRRIARDAHRRKYKKNKGNILHAYAETNELKNRLLKKLKAVDLECVACVVEKEKIKQSDVYLYATEQIAKHFENQDVTIVIVARRDTRKSYNQSVLDIYTEHNIIARFSDPTKDKSLQIADFYSWSIFSYFEKANSEYFKKILDVVKLLK